MKPISRLKQVCNLFEQLDDTLLQKQVKKGFITSRMYEATDYLDIIETNALVCIIEGALDIMEISEEGNLILMEHFENGACIGANTLFSNSNGSNVIGRTYTALHVVTIHKEGVFDMLQSDARFLKDFLELISKRSTMLTRKISSLSFKSLEDKLMNFLYDLSKRQRTNPVRLYLSKKRLAELFGVARTSLSRRLRAMETRDLIEVKKRSILLKSAFFEIHKKNFVRD